MRDSQFEEDTREEFYSPYCPLCDGCGEDGCCPAVFCKGSGGKYCQTYLEDLKEAYRELHNHYKEGRLK